MGELGAAANAPGAQDTTSIPHVKILLKSDGVSAS
jgi:hypothetical protein